ncbi:MAG: hypothetical protein KUG51_01120 [Urechidicola sp.]|nr:hypothetical protein [Urechidicola sp.]
MKKISLLLAILLICSVAFSQEEENEDSKRKGKRILPFRIGLKAGLPNGIGGNVEYVTPLLNDRIAFFGDYSGFSTNIDDADAKMQYYEFGTNIYLFGGKGRGVYGSLSYGKLNLDANYDDYEFDTSSGTVTADAEGEYEVGTFNVKAGLKVGRRFYFRTELGYGFGSVPQEFVITGTANGMTESETVEIPEIPGMSENGYVMFNIGFGIGF